MVAPLKVGIAGLGTVGAEVVRLIEQQSRVLSTRCGRSIRVVAVTARSKVKKRGIDLRGVTWAKNPLAVAVSPPVRSASSTSSKARAEISTPAPKAMTVATTRTGTAATHATSAPSSSAPPPSSPHPAACTHNGIRAR